MTRPGIKPRFPGPLANSLLIRPMTRKVKLATVVEGNPRAPFSITTTPRCIGGRYSFLSGLLHFALYPYLIMQRVKQGGIKYHFLSFWYDST